MRIFYTTIISLLISFAVNSQTINLAPNDSSITKKNLIANHSWPLTVNLKQPLKIEIDSNKFQFGLCPECYSIEIQDTSRFANTIIELDKNGNIISFWQNFQNRIGFDYDKTTGKLRTIFYEDNKGKFKSITIK